MAIEAALSCKWIESIPAACSCRKETAVTGGHSAGPQKAVQWCFVDDGCIKSGYLI